MFTVALAIGALLLPSYGLVLPGVASAGRSIYQAPTAIDRSGGHDVAAALTWFIGTVPDGSTITFPAGSRYRIESIVLVGHRNNLVIDGAGALFFATTDGSGVAPTGPNDVQQHWPRHRDQWLIYNSTNVTVRNLTVRSANPNGGTSDAAYVSALEAQAGVEFYQTTNGVLENSTISDTYGDLVYIGHGATGTKIRGCTMTRSGRQAITVSYGRGVAIAGNQISQIRRSAIDLEPYTSTWGVENVWIVNNTFTSVRLDVIAAKAEGDVSEIVVAYNHLVHEPLSVRNTPVSTGNPRRHDWYVIGNTSDTKFGSPHGAIWITYTDHVGVSDNYQPLQAGRWPIQIGVQTTGSTDVTVTGNTFPMV